MPQIQIIGQEKLQARMGARDRELKRQELSQQAFEKSIQFKQMDQQLKLMAKNTENEIEKLKIQRLGDRMSYMSNVFKTAMDNPNPESVIKTAMRLGGKEMMDDMSDPLVGDMIKRLSPSGEASQKQAVASTLNSPLIRQRLGYNDTPAAPPETQSQTKALSGETSAQSGYDLGPEIGIDAGPINLKLINRDLMNKMTTEKEIATNAGQPLSENTANAVAFKEEAKPLFKDIYTKVDDLVANGDSMGWFGGAKINAGSEEGPGQALLRTQESSKQRELALILNKIKQIAFTYGGKTLSPTERTLVFSALSPVNKSPSQWKKDLQWAESRLTRAAELQITPQGKAFNAQPAPAIGDVPQNNPNDPLDLFGGK